MKYQKMNISLNSVTFNKMEMYRICHGLTRSELIRNALDLYIDNYYTAGKTLDDFYRSMGVIKDVVPMDKAEQRTSTD